jgi:hypothetical protein
MISPDEDQLVCKVDDIELDLDEDGRPYVSAILVGPLALGPNIGGIIHAVGRRLREEGDPDPPKIGFEHVHELSNVIKVDPPGRLGVHRLESWTRDRIIKKLPGARHETQ